VHFLRSEFSTGNLSNSPRRCITSSCYLYLFHPEAVILGGGVIKAGEILFDNVRKTVKARAQNRSSRGVRLLPASFGLKAAALGTIALVMNKLLNPKLESFLTRNKKRFRSCYKIFFHSTTLYLRKNFPRLEKIA
jgi:hypothetical protein